MYRRVLVDGPLTALMQRSFQPDRQFLFVSPYSMLPFPLDVQLSAIAASVLVGLRKRFRVDEY